MIFEFTITFSVLGLKWDEDTISDKIFGSGLGDALILTGIRGIIGLEIFRESASAEDAIQSAIHDILDVFRDAVLLDIQPDLVSISDMTKIIGQSKQNLRNLVGFLPSTEYTAPQI